MGWLKRSREKDEVKDGDPLSWVAGDDELDGDGRSEQDAPDADDAGSDTGDSAERQGPWDVSEVESSDSYVDLGGLWLPGRDGMELRLEVEEESGRKRTKRSLEVEIEWVEGEMPAGSIGPA